MDTPHERIAELEARLLSDPDCREFRHELIDLYFEAGLGADRRRFRHVLWYVRHHPTSSFARCPLALFPRSASPDDYDEVEAAWRAHVESDPDDVDKRIGLATFVALDDRPRSIALLRDFVRARPKGSAAWAELGRVATEPAERLAAFLEARRSGSEHPNLLVWIARAAIDADDLDVARTSATELLAGAAATREEHGERFDWAFDGRELFEKVLAATGSRDRARALTSAIADHAYSKHWGHTVLGVVAARSGDVADAVEHLRKSVAIRADHRLRSYGPALSLAAELCRHDQWEPVVEYLNRCRSFWTSDALERYLRDVNDHRCPDFGAR